MSAVSGRRWELEFDGLPPPCTLEAYGDEWIVSLARTTTARGLDLTEGIVNATAASPPAPTHGRQHN